MILNIAKRRKHILVFKINLDRQMTVVPPENERSCSLKPEET